MENLLCGAKSGLESTDRQRHNFAKITTNSVQSLTTHTGMPSKFSEWSTLLWMILVIVFSILLEFITFIDEPIGDEILRRVEELRRRVDKFRRCIEHRTNLYAFKLIFILLNLLGEVGSTKIFTKVLGKFYECRRSRIGKGESKDGYFFPFFPKV